MTTYYRVDVSFPYASLLPRDVAVNTFHLQTLSGDDPSPGWDTDVTNALQGYYNDGTTSIANFISSVVTRATPSTIKCYEVGVEGPPLWESTFTPDTSSSTASLPLEVALCQSYACDPIVGRPAARSRGRHYIGPLNSDARTGSTSGVPPVPATGLITAMALAGENLCSAIGGFNVAWSIYSRVAASGAPVTHGWIDNEFDTQRRRQVEASARTTWAV